MSYEGYVEKLCENGHYYSVDAFMDMDAVKATCPLEDCNAYFVFTHSVDQTNGIEHDDDGVPYPGTVPYPFKEVRFEDIWHEDHHGNRYATKLIIYKIPERKE